MTMMLHRFTYFIFQSACLCYQQSPLWKSTTVHNRGSNINHLPLCSTFAKAKLQTINGSNSADIFWSSHERTAQVLLGSVEWGCAFSQAAGECVQCVRGGGRWVCVRGVRCKHWHSSAEETGYMGYCDAITNYIDINVFVSCMFCLKINRYTAQSSYTVLFKMSINYSHNKSTCTSSHKHTHTHTHTRMAQAFIQSKNTNICSKYGCSILSKNSATCRMEQEIEPPTFWEMDDPLYPLSHSCPK